MNDEFCDDLDFADDDKFAPPRAAAAHASTALVIEDDPALARVCTRTLSRLGMNARVVWNREEAAAALARTTEPLAFVYADARILGGTCDDAASLVRGRRPATPFVVGGGSLADVLTSDCVSICGPFDQDQFEAAFDASLFDEESRRLLEDAAEAARRDEPSLAAALAALPPAAQASLQLSA